MSEFKVPTYEELLKFSEEIQGKCPEFRYAREWSLTIGAGWDHEKYQELYSLYIYSTQITLSPKDDATELKGRPLERVARYFLKNGGIVSKIDEISAPGKWQVDGQGPLEKSNIILLWGEKLSRRIGFQVYLECKNHNDPVTKGEFSDHYRRMEEHCCNFGVMVSTSGYRIGSGKGIAESVYINTMADKFHILLTINTLRLVISDRIPPLVLLRESLDLAVNDKYRNDKNVQTLYSQKICHETAKSEFTIHCQSLVKK